MALKVLIATSIFLCLCITSCSNESVNTPDPDITIPAMNTDIMQALPAAGSLSDFPGIVSGFTISGNSILLTDERPCITVQTNEIPNTVDLEAAVTLLINGDPITVDTIDTQSNPGSVKYCYTVDSLPYTFNLIAEMTFRDSSNDRI